MRISDLSLPRLFLLLCCSFLIPLAAWPQAASPQSRIVDRVNDGALVTLRGNTHPLAQPQFDQGAAPPDLPMARMLLVLKRSAAQESALQSLLDNQQDLISPSYHQWLTPDQFGQQFGPSDQDMQVIAAWLISHGFQISGISRGRTVIEFSGTAAQVLQAFHTEIHKYIVNGLEHWANVSDPQIPAALAPVVAGINTLYNFPRQQMHEIAGPRANAVGALKPAGPFFTFPNPCSVNSQPFCNFAVGPADFAKIYDVPNLLNPPPAPAAPFNGDGVTIAIVGESQINTNDVAQFRAFFGLPALTGQQLNVIVNGSDPGTSGAETEADLDVELAGSIAPNATIDLVIAQSTEVSLGVDFAAQYAVDNNLGSVLNESFGTCEFFMGTANNAFYNQLWQQAAAQGISVFVSSGDSGSAVCDGDLGAQGPAQLGLSVNGASSTPYNVSVGGTDFNEVNDWLTFWNMNNISATFESAKGYVPEVPWNNTCTNPEVPALVGLPASTTAEHLCNDTSVTSNFPFLLDPIGGSGGKSGCTTSDSNPATGAGTLSTCSGGYAKPSWQTALTPNDGKRDLPDVSLFASNGFNGSSYAICELDAPPQAVIGACGTSQLVGIGGTSASSPAFAAIMALIDQATGSRQGNPNYVLYKLAAQGGNTCTSTANPASTCIFYDVPSGFTIAMPCVNGKPNCNVLSSGDTVGVLSGYATSSGYDLATGLGSVNAAKLIKNWKSFPLTASTTTLTLTPPNGSTLSTLRHGQSVGVNVNVAPQSGNGPPTPSGNVSLIANTGPNGTEGVQGFTLSGGVASGSTTSLPGGSYTVFAQYAGDGTFGSSLFSPAIPVTVSAEASQPNIALELFDPATGGQTNANATTAPYGSLEVLRMNVTSKSGDACAQNAPGATGCPTGSVTITNNGAPLDAGTYALNSQGFAEDTTAQLPTGSNNLTLAYAGDNSFNASNGNAMITITPAPTTTTVIPQPNVIIGQAFNITAQMVSNSLGVAPTGTFTALDGTVQVESTGPLTGFTSSGQVFLNGSVQATLTAPSGPHTLTARYSGDTNYGSSTSSGAVVNAVYATSATAMANPTAINLGQSASITVTVTGASKSPPMTGTFQFSGVANPVSGTPSTDASGNQTLTAIAMVSPQNSGANFANYSGDSNYAWASAFVSITVNLPDFNLGTSVPNLPITAGQTGTTQITLTPVNNISDSVALSCNFNGFQIVTLPCSFNPPSPLSVSNGKAATATLSIATLPPSSSPSTSFIGIRRLRWEGIWPPGSWMFALAGGLAILLLSLSASRKRRRLAGALGMAGLLFLALSCGSGGGGSGGGGGGGGQAPTTLTLTTSSVKVASGTNFALTATVHSTNPATGYVYFYDNTLGTDIQGVAVNGVSTVQLTEVLVGTHMFSARYNGDANNQPSQTSGSINQVITGTGQLTVIGTGLGNSHSSTMNVTIQ